MAANRRAQSWDVCVWIRPLTIGCDYRGRARGRRKSARRVNGLYVIVVEEKRADRGQVGNLFLAGNFALCSVIVGVLA